MKNYKLDNELKDLSKCVYRGNERYKPKDYIKVTSKRNEKTGFDAKVFYKNNDVVIVFRGSDELKDWTDSNKDMAISNFPSQTVDARNFYNQVKSDFPNQKIVLTGHSLGGSLAQIIGSKTGDKTVTFGAYGVGNIVKTDQKTHNITNYGNAKDIVFISNIDNQIGNTFVIDNYETNEGEIGKSTEARYENGFQNHKLENMGDLSKSVVYKGQNLQTEDTLLLKASVEKNIDYKDIDPNRILTNEEIGEMTKDEFLQNEEFINQQMKNGKILPKAEAQRRLKSGDLVWVNAYQRDDGTEVKGYYRRK